MNILFLDDFGEPLAAFSIRPNEPIPKEFDFIYAFTGYWIPQVIWKKFNLKMEVIERIENQRQSRHSQ